MKTILLRVRNTLIQSGREKWARTGAADSRLPIDARAGGAPFGGQAEGGRRLRTRRLSTEIGRLRRTWGSAAWSQPLRRLLALLVFSLAFALPARAEDFYFNTTQGRLEQLNGLTATIHGVGAGTMGLDGNVGVFSFAGSIAFQPGDRLFYRGDGSRAVRIDVNGNINIPAGVTIDVSRALGWVHGGAGGGSGGTEGSPGTAGVGPAGGAGGVGGGPGLNGDGASGGPNGAGGRGGDGGPGTANPGGNGFNQLNAGGPAAGGGSRAPGSAGGPSSGIRTPGGPGGAFLGLGSPGTDGPDGLPGLDGAAGASGSGGAGGSYANPTRLLVGGGGGASGRGGDGGGGGGSGSSGAGGGAGGDGGLILGPPNPQASGGSGGAGGKAGDGGNGAVGGAGGAGGNGGGALELRATGTITVGGIIRANGTAGLPAPGVPGIGPGGSFGLPGAAGVVRTSTALGTGGSGGDGGHGGPGGRGGAGGVGGPGGGGAGGTIILKAGVGVVKLAGSVIEARGGAAGGPGAVAGQDGLVIEDTPAGLLGLEDFGYAPATSLIGQNGGTFFDWNNVTRTRTGTRSAWGSSFGTSPTTTSERTLITTNQGVRRPYGATESNGAFNGAGVVYYKIEMTRLASTGSTGLISEASGNARAFFGVPLAVEPGSGQQRFAIHHVPSGTINYSTIAPVTGRRYTLVAKIDFDKDLLSLWVDPQLGLPEEQNPPVATLAHTESNASTAVRITAGGSAEWDNLAVATTWETLAITVTTLTDEDNGNLSPTFGGGTGVSLREAVKYAPSGSLIVFDPQLSGKTILFTGGEILVNRNVSIDASDLPGGLTLSGGSDGDALLEPGETRHFRVQSGANLRLTALTLVDGMTDDSGGSIVHTDSELTIERCLFRKNRALVYGGAIRHQGGSLRLRHSTLVENFADSEGGAIDTESPLAEITHCTITGNQAGTGGGINRLGSALTLTASVVAENIATNTGADVAGTITNVESQIGGAPMLAPLGAYGGPTLTRPPFVGSPIIDAVTATGLGFSDQRGFPRIVDGDANGTVRADCGAVEAGPLLVVNSLADAGGNFDLRTLLNATVVFRGARIGFNPALFNPGATITLAGSQLTVPTVAGGVFFDATNIPVAPTINAAGLSRVLEVPEGASATLWNLRITGGNASPELHGGGILNQGTLALHRATVAGNTARGGGGGIRNAGRLVVIDSTIADNGLPSLGVSPLFGGGISAVAGSTLIERSSVVRNASSFEGGGIQCSNAKLTMRNSTVAGNSAVIRGGGVYSFQPEAPTLEFTTIAGNTAPNGGGISTFSAQFSLRGCIVAGNTATDGNNDISTSGGATITATGPNLIGDNTGSGLAAVPSLIGTPSAPVRARLTPLGNYGGPSETMLPLPGSPAIGASGSDSLTIDQRGFARTFPTDIGAAEFIAGDYYTVTTTTDNVAGSLRQRLSDAPSGGLIVFDPAVFTGGAANRIALTSQLTAPAGKTLLLDATDVGGLTLDAGGSNFRVLTVPAGAALTLKTMTLRGGRTTGGQSGGGVFNAGTLTLRDCTITDCASAESSGAIHNEHPGLLTLERCTLHRNSAQAGGGAISHVSSNLLTLTACTLTDNTARFEAGAINAPFNLPLTLTHCTITGNAVTNAGSNGVGGVRSDPGVATGALTVRDSIICGNTDANTPGFPNLRPTYDSQGNNLVDVDAKLSPLAPRGGPTETMPPLPGSPALDAALNAPTTGTDQRGFPRAIASTLGGTARPDIGAVERGPVVLVTTADDSGSGSLRSALAAATAPDTRITFAPTLDGQTISLRSPELSIPATQNVEIDATMLSRGLALSSQNARRVLNNSGILSLHRLTLRDGFAPGDSGGGLRSGGTVLVVDCTLAGNTAINVGGGVFLLGGVADFHRCTISGNAAGSAGGLWQEGTTRTSLTNCTVADNRSTDTFLRIGGIAAINGTLALRHTTVTQNVGNGLGGGLYLGAPAIVTIECCLVAGNRDLGSNRADINFNSGTLTPIGPSFIGNNESVATQFPQGLLVGTAAAPLDPRLGPLATRGAFTATMPPLTGSAAIDAGGAPTTLLTDQRGLPRPIGALVDLGAAERGPLLTVTNTNDSGPGSLRDTLAAATTPDTRIVFNSALNGQTITLTSDLLFIDAPQNVEIDATALPLGLALSGQNARRCFFSLGVLSLHRLTLRDGSADFGPGLASIGPLLAADCTFTGNTAINGGGAYVGGDRTADFHRCTISGNTASFAAGIFQDSNVRTTLTNCTVAENRSTGDNSPGGIFAFGGTLALRHTTVTQNVGNGRGGGLFLTSGNIASIERCIIAGNRDPGSARPDIYFEGGTLTAIGPSLIGSNESVATQFPPGLLVGTAFALRDPRLGPLAPRGALTATAPPLTGSPAIDAGDAPTTLFADQRGLPRPPGALVDLGAAERGPLLTVTNTSDSDPGSLRAALAAATTPDTRITFDPGLDGATIPLTSTELSIGSTRNVEIDASALTSGIAVSGQNARRVLNNAGVVSLHRLTLRNGSAIAGGGLGSIGGTVLAVDCTIAGNTTTNTGGGVFLNGGIADFHRCTISGNAAGSSGGGAILQSVQTGTTRTTLTNCTVADNRSTSTSSSGGIHVLGGTMALRHTTLTQNTGNGRGGGLFLISPATVTVERCIIAGNRDLGSTRADIFLFSGTLTPIGPSLIGSNESVATPFPTGALVGIAAAPLAPGLAPLDGYTGPTFTAPPIPGSPAINAATGSTTDFDQRRFPRIGTADLGAAEFRGVPDVQLYWQTDWDADGQRFGLEHALGTDALRSDRGNSRNLTAPIIDGLGRPQVTFGVNNAALPGTQWRIARSTTLQAGSFTEIFRFDGTAYTFNSAQVLVVDNGDTITVIDRLPPIGKGFYRLEALSP